MKLRFELGTLLAATCMLVGCYKQPAVTRELLIGNYTFVSNDPERRPTDHDHNQLILRSDGTYDLLEGGSTKTLSEKRGRWRIVSGNPPNVLLDYDGYPIETKRHEVRLLIDLDTRVWWTKRR